MNKILAFLVALLFIGSASASYEIKSCKDIERIGQGANYPGASDTDSWPLDGDYILVQDIDCSATNPQNPSHDATPETTYGEDGFNPVWIWVDKDGDSEPSTTWDHIEYFSGTLDGQGYTVSGLYMNSVKYPSQPGASRPWNPVLGIFAYTTSDAVIRNLRIADATIKNGASEYASGSLVGYAGSPITDITLDNITIEGRQILGSLVGESNSTIDNITATNILVKNSSSSGNFQMVGGIAGVASAITNTSISGSVMTDDIPPNGGDVGGIVGITSEVRDSYANVTVTVNEHVSEVGGVAGSGSCYNCVSEGNVTGSINVGGLIANAEEVYSSVSYGNVTGVGNDLYVGGLVGYLTGTIQSSYATGDVSDTSEGGSGSNSTVGGLVGTIYAAYEGVNIKIRDSFSLGKVSGNGNNTLGGMIGRAGSPNSSFINKVSNAFVVGDVDYGAHVDGLEGYTMGPDVAFTVENSFSSINQLVDGVPVAVGINTKATGTVRDDELKSSFWYQDSLLWGTDEWEFNDGLYPKVRKYNVELDSYEAELVPNQKDLPI